MDTGTDTQSALPAVHPPNASTTQHPSPLPCDELSTEASNAQGGGVDTVLEEIENHIANNGVVVRVPPSNEASLRTASPSPPPPSAATAAAPSRSPAPPAQAVSSPISAERHGASPLTRTRPTRAAAAAASPATISTTNAATSFSLSTGALRFTCCRCRQHFVVRPGEYRSTSLTRLASHKADQPMHTHTPGNITTPLYKEAAVDVCTRQSSTTCAPSSQDAAPALQAALYHSARTCGDGQRYRPFPHPTGETCVNATPTLDSEESGATVWDAALLDALRWDFFPAADALTEEQLAILLSHAQDVVSVRTSRGGAAFASPSRLCAASTAMKTPDGRCNSAAVALSGSACKVQRGNESCSTGNGSVVSRDGVDDGPAASLHVDSAFAFLDVDYLAALGVIVASLSPSSERNNVDGSTSSGNPQPRSHTQRQPDSITDTNSSGRSSSTTRSPPDLTADATQAMNEVDAWRAQSDDDAPSPMRQLTHHGAEDDEESVTDVPALSFLAAAPPPAAAVATAGATAESEMPVDACCDAAQVPCPAGKTSSLLRDHDRTAGQPLPFDEVYRRWMRLLISSAPPAAASSTTTGADSSGDACLPAQPLCLECWTEACLMPLQRHARRVADECETLDGVLREQAKEELQRWWTLVCSPVPQQDAVFGAHTSGALKEIGKEVPAASLALDAVAANIFGPQECAWLDTMSALSAPQQRRQQEQRGTSAGDGGEGEVHSRSTTASCCAVYSEDTMKDVHSAVAPADEAEAEALQRGRAELQALLAEFDDVTAQQASLEAQRRELHDVLQALNGGDTDSFTAAATAVSPADVSAGAQWSALAEAHNTREVRDAFTQRDEAAERRCSMQELALRYDVVAATSIDALCFPVDVSGPMGMIAGLRLGLVPPYSNSGGSSQNTAVASTEELNGNGVHSCGIEGHTATPSEESMALEGFQRRQVLYTQLFLSGNTTGSSGVDALAHRQSSGVAQPSSSSFSTPPPPPPNGVAAAVGTPHWGTGVDSVRVSLAELNAASGYLLLLLNYLAHVNGFSFQTAVLRPAGDRSTVALLKRISASSPAAPTATASSLPNPFGLFGLFSRGATTTTTAATAGQTSTSATATAAAATDWPATRASYVVDYEVDFFITDRLFAWRTFGAACVAVAACVRELSDALHESLRCWRVRETMVRRQARNGGEEEKERHAAGVAGKAGEAEGGGKSSQYVSRGIQPGCCGGPSTAPVSLPRLVESLEGDAHAPAAALRGAPSAGVDAAPAAAAPAPFPLQPPYRIQNDTVDGFSVRHGSTTEAIWTLGMKKLLANVQWCMAATVELERLYAVTGEGPESDEDAG